MSATDDDEAGEPQTLARPGETDADWLQKKQAGSILHGVLMVAGAHAATFFVLALLDELTHSSGWLAWMLFVGVTQLVYVIPLARWMDARGRPRTVKGIWIAAGISALLNAACFGIGIATFSPR